MCRAPVTPRGVLAFLLAAIEAATEIPAVADVTRTLVKLIGAEDGDASEASQCLAAIMLKAGPAALDELVATVVQGALLPSARADVVEGREWMTMQSVVAVAWCARALCYRSHRDFMPVTTALVGLVHGRDSQAPSGDVRVSMWAAGAVGIPLLDAPGVGIASVVRAV